MVILFASAFLHHKISTPWFFMYVSLGVYSYIPFVGNCLSPLFFFSVYVSVDLFRMEILSTLMSRWVIHIKNSLWSTLESLVATGRIVDWRWEMHRWMCCLLLSQGTSSWFPFLFLTVCLFQLDPGLTWI